MVMKNQAAKFSCATDASLTITVHRGKKNLTVALRLRTPGEKIKQGIDYFELSEEGQAQARYDTLVKEATTNGWKWTESSRRNQQLTSVPMAPGAKTSMAGGQTSKTPMAASGKK
jgi:hypothetical protein